ncbi:unnamed protein product, partial [Sphacelaria rigidula]
MPDARKGFVANVIAGLSAKTTREDALREVNEREELQLFLDDPSVAVLYVHAAETGGLQLSNRLSISEEQKGEGKGDDSDEQATTKMEVGLHFVKLRPEPVTA